MDKEIKFSIIVPVYNTNIDYLNSCLDCLFNLNYNFYEVIIVNDGSNDIILNFLNNINHPNVRIVNQDNSGQFMSRINGVNIASGDYIIFVDSDDIIDANSLTYLNEILNKKRYDMILFGCSRFKDDIKNILYTSNDFIEGEVTKKEVVGKLLNLKINSVCLKCVKKSIAHVDINLIDCNIREGEDIAHSAYYVKYSNSFYYTNKNIYFYRLNEENRDYYGIDKLNNINFMVPVYYILFSNQKDINRNELLMFKNSSIKAIVSYLFNTCNYKEKYSQKKELFDNIQKQDIIRIIDSIKIKTSFIYESIYHIYREKVYFLICFLAFLYNSLTRQNK